MITIACKYYFVWDISDLMKDLQNMILYHMGLNAITDASKERWKRSDVEEAIWLLKQGAMLMTLKMRHQEICSRKWERQKCFSLFLTASGGSPVLLTLELLHSKTYVKILTPITRSINMCSCKSWNSRKLSGLCSTGLPMLTNWNTKTAK